MKPLISFLIALCLLCLLPFALADEEPFAPQGNYRVFCADGLYGVQTLDGETVIPARFEGIQPFVGDLCVVELSDEEDEMYEGLWRLSTGDELLPCEYYEITIDHGLVLTSGVRDPEADIIMMVQIFDPETASVLLDVRDTEYEGIWEVGDGKNYELYIWDEEEILVTPDGTPLLDSDGFVLVEIMPESNGIATVYEDEYPYKMRYFNTATGAFLEGKYDNATPFADGFAAVRNGLFSAWVIDEEGNAVTPVYLDIAYNNYDIPEYGEGLFAVRQADGWSVIRVHTDAEPDILFGPVICTEAPYYLGSRAFAFPTGDGLLVFSGACERSVLLEGVDFIDHLSSPFIGDCLVFERDGQYGFLFDDMTVVGPAWEGGVGFLGDHGFVSVDGLWHPIDRSGQADMSVSYPFVRQSNDGSFYLVKYDDGNYLCLDRDLQPISHMSYYHFNW